MRMTMAQVGAALVLLSVAAAPVQAELKYTVRIEARDVTSAAPANPAVAALGAAAVEAIAPAGGLDLTVTIGPGGTRVDYAKGHLGVPAGGSTVVRPDGSMIVIDPATRTYWQMAKPAATRPDAAPRVTVKRTGEFATVAGVRAERAAIEIQVPLTGSTGATAAMPAGTTLSGDVWFSSQFKDYAERATGVGGSLLGIETLGAEGFMVRSILRGDLLGGREIESIVTSLAETAVPAGFFEVPAGFSEATPPSRPTR